MKITGISLAIIEISLFFLFIYQLRKSLGLFHNVNDISYFWIMFTIMTGIWEFFYLNNRPNVKQLSSNLIKNKSHVWTNKYSLKNLLPHHFSNLFYAEYASYADREYMDLDDIWSLEIEGSHCILCGFINLVALLFNLLNIKVYLLLIIISMSGQLMNSLLYCGQYLIEIKNINSVNYPTLNFPTGRYLLKRPFIYINVFWTIMPIYVLISIITRYSIFVVI